jgi:DNA-binding CsgD family transcriptional regulator
MQSKTREVLKMKANGMLSKQIAAKLNIHRRTVEWHMQMACMELGAKNSYHAVAIAVRDGLILASEIGCILLLCCSGLFFDEDARRGPVNQVCRSARREVIV